MSAPAGRQVPLTWGARLGRDGQARFRLWAPGLDALALEHDGRQAAMQRHADGWFEGVAEGAAPGQTYRFVLPDGRAVPDPAARAQADDVHGPSVLVDPGAYRWRNAGWRGRPWREAVLYEAHVGTATQAGTFAALGERLAGLADLGVTALELMPVAQFAGRRGWGYDGVLPYAPHPAYGTPDELKALVDAAHDHGLMVLLDVVYNHFGPEGNHIAAYAPDFFHPERHTPWGAAIAYERRPVRDFFVDNALYWLEEFQFDGLRFDAIDHIVDDLSERELMVEIAERVRADLPGRHIHLTTEDNRNITRLHERGPGGAVRWFTAEWNDDFHNVAHRLATGETDGYYADFAEAPWRKLARALAEGFAYQGEPSPHGGGRPRGAPSGHLPPEAFVDFLQNHDQVGNRALGERLTTLVAPEHLALWQALLVLSPHIPLLFMGEEYGETRPFLFFTDFAGALADAVREGRRREFAGFAAFAGHTDTIPDPNASATFARSRLDAARRDSAAGRQAAARLKRLLALRRAHVVPLLAGGAGGTGRVRAVAEGAVAVDWTLSGRRLALRVNFSDAPCALPPADGGTIYASPDEAAAALARDGALPPRAIVVAERPT